MGLEVERDAFGNLLSRTGAEGAEGAERSVLLCAHLDTVPNHGPIEPVEVDEGWENARADILGADNKAAVAVMLVAAARAALPVGLELLFTLQEENGLNGARAFDVSRLRSQWGYVYDHATPIGDVIVASPSYYRVVATFHGKAAHAGIRPEDGRNAILAAARAALAVPHGRIDDETTANIGTITGGDGHTNVVPATCAFYAEVRSLDAGRAEATVAEMVDRIQDAAEDVDVDIDVSRGFDGYRHAPDVPAVLAAEAALRACGYEPRRIVTGGASDANAFEAAGFRCTNLANGTERNHEPTERVSFAALEGMLGVTFELLEACSS